MHVIAAVTDERVVTHVVLTHTIKSEDVMVFICDAATKMRELYSGDDRHFVFLYDNAPVHRTKMMIEAVKRNKCLSILNSPYAPDLNFCEKFIRLHKRKVQHLLKNMK